MRVAFPLIVLTLATGAAAEPPSQIVIPVAPDRSATPEGQAVCRDTIHQVREARGLPRLEDAPPPQLIAAVDQRIGGCSVMVMRNDTSDIRPLPMAAGEARLQRIPAR
jgi:hypothetical protein